MTEPGRRLRFEIVVAVNPEKADAAEILRRSTHPKRMPFVGGAWAMGTLISLDAHDYRQWCADELAQQEAEERRGYEKAVAELSALWKAANGYHEPGHRDECDACRANCELHRRLS